MIHLSVQTVRSINRLPDRCKWFRHNLEGGVRYLRMQLDTFDGNVEHALAAYNAGPKRVMDAGGIPRIKETQGYVRAIIGRLNQDLKP